jgi:hypothetical protein
MDQLLSVKQAAELLGPPFDSRDGGGERRVRFVHVGRYVRIPLEGGLLPHPFI